MMVVPDLTGLVSTGTSQIISYIFQYLFFKVEFQISVSERTKHQMAVNVTVVKRNSDVKHLVCRNRIYFDSIHTLRMSFRLLIFCLVEALSSRSRLIFTVVYHSKLISKISTTIFHLALKGFVAMLKENFGFIELADHEKEVFFRYA